MATGGTHRDLLAWQEAMKLVEMLYQETRALFRDELFGLTGQLRRAAISVPSNIAEGAGRNSAGELSQFLGIACGSLAELETHIELAVRLGYMSPICASHGQLDRVGQLLVALRKSVRTTSKSGSK